MLSDGCDSARPVVGTGPVEPTPSFADLAAAHNQRVAALQEVYATGVIELHWKDSKGRHSHQGDLEMWIRQPRQTAMRVAKVGEVLFWLGSDADRFWGFNLTDKPRTLEVGRHERGVQEDQAAAFGVRPLVLLDLMGLSPMPQSSADATVEADDASHTWKATYTAPGGRVAMYVDRATRLPVRIEALDAAGKAVALCSLSKYESVQKSGMLPVAYPKMPFRIELKDAAEAEDDPAASGRVLIALGEAWGELDPDEAARVFDLHRLAEGMRPDRLIGDAPDIDLSGTPKPQ